MSMELGTRFNGVEDDNFSKFGTGIYSGSASCVANPLCERILNFNSPNFKENVGPKTPKAYVQEMQQRMRLDGFTERLCVARVTALGTLGTMVQETLKSACAKQREIPDHCGEGCPENMECKYEATRAFANTCQCKAGFTCTGTWAIVLSAPPPSRIPNAMTVSQGKYLY